MLFIVISHKIKQMPLIDNLQLYFSMSQQENKGLQRIIPVKQSQLRQEKLNSIDALYRAQIRQIYSESKDKINNKEIQSKTQIVQTPKVSEHRVSFSNNVFKSQIQKGLTHAKSYNNILNTQLSSTSRTFQYNEADDKIRASVYLKGESTRTIQILRKQNQLKELKIRQLTSKCQNLIDRLKKYLDPEELEIQLRNIKETSDHKTQRLQKLFKIKNQEIFFKIKLQIIGLLQEFGIKKQQLNDVNEVSNEANLFSFMARKLKNRLKDFKSKQQQSNFEIQKDKVMNQKHEERIHFLIQTNQLLKLSEVKAKNKIEDLKTQLKEYIEKLKIKEQEKQSIQNQVFRLTRQNQQLNIVNQKLNNTLKGVNGDKLDERRVWQAKQKQLKLLLGNYNLQKKKMENQLQQKQGQIEQILIKQKFVQQENDRLNRQLVRWKQRYDWTQQDKQTKLREIEEEKNYIMTQFQNYKNENNQGIIMGHRTQLDEADRQMKQLQREYESALYQIDDQKRLFQRKQEQHEQKMLIMQRQWLNKVKNLQKLKEQELSDIKQDHQNRISQLRQYYERKQQLLAEEMQGRMKAMLAQRDKKMTQQFMLLQNENDHLRQQLQKSNKLLSIKESLLNVIQSKNMSHYEK